MESMPRLAPGADGREYSGASRGELTGQLDNALTQFFRPRAGIGLVEAWQVGRLPRRCRGQRAAQQRGGGFGMAQFGLQLTTI